MLRGARPGKTKVIRDDRSAHRKKGTVNAEVNNRYRNIGVAENWKIKPAVAMIGGRTWRRRCQVEKKKKSKNKFGNSSETGNVGRGREKKAQEMSTKVKDRDGRKSSKKDGRE